MTSFAVVGAGFGGVGAAVLLRRAGYRDVTVFERGERIGGVWSDNTYPGAACDVPSHLYEFSFAPNPDWSRRYAPQAEIQAYLEDVARREGVIDRIRTGAEVTRATFDEERAKWVLETSAGTHEADMLITACGQLSTPSVPAIPGLDSFDGPAFHSARWRHDVPLHGKRVAVIGGGCSAIQIVPAIQPTVGHVDVYQRSPGWTLPKLDAAYGERAQRAFKRMPILQRLDREANFYYMETGALALTSQPWLRPALRAVGRWQITKAIKDPELRRKVTPADEIGCKRMMLTDHWYPTLTRPNVSVITDRIEGVTPSGIRTADGSTHPADVLVLATGFKTHGFVAPMEVFGAAGTEPGAGVVRARARLPRSQRPGVPEHVPALRAEHERRDRLGDLHDRGRRPARDRGGARARAQPGADDRGPPRRRRKVRSGAARGAQHDRLAHGVHQLVHRRERQRSEPVAVDLEHLPPSDLSARAGRIPTGLRVRAGGLRGSPRTPLSTESTTPPRV